MADSLELKEAELDYEAEEAEEQAETPTPRDATPTLPSTDADTPDHGAAVEAMVERGVEDGTEEADTISQTSLPDDVDVSTDLINSPAQDGELGDDDDDDQEDGDQKDEVKGKEDDGDGELESGEELEDGEISDEDEALKNERLEPKPVCRFFSKGQCTWGSSCRFLHPGVLDKGNYSMFAAPRPILPGESSTEQDAAAAKGKVKI